MWGIPSPTNRGHKNHLFRRLRNLTSCNSNGLYIPNKTWYRQSGKCIATRLGFKTCLSKTKTKTQQFQDQDQDQDSAVSRPRLRSFKTKTKTCLSKTKTETETQDLQDHDWKSMTGMNCDKQKVMASRKSSIPVVAHSKQKTSYYV